MADVHHRGDSSRAPGDGPEDSWISGPQSEPLRKRPESRANEPTVTAMPEAVPPKASNGPPAGQPAAGGPVVGPPPPAPAMPQPPPPAPGASPYAPGPFGAGSGAYGASMGYGPYGGYPPQVGPHGPAVPPMPYGYGPPGGFIAPLPSGQSTAAMVLGIVSLVLILTGYGIFFAVVTSPIALGLGVSARRKVDRGEQGGRASATAGFVMGIIGSVISAVALVGVLIAASEFVGSSEDDPVDEDPGYSDTYNAGESRR